MQSYYFNLVSIVLFSVKLTIKMGVEPDLLCYLFPFHAAIRGWLVRRDSSHVNKLRKHHENEKPKRKSRIKMPEVKVFYYALKSSLIFSVRHQI